VYAFPFRDAKTGGRAFWRDVGTLDAFWEANMELVSLTPELNLAHAAPRRNQPSRSRYSRPGRGVARGA
jgi:ADP-glucose pyrophosphorylase